MPDGANWNRYATLNTEGLYGPAIAGADASAFSPP